MWWLEFVWLHYSSVNPLLEFIKEHEFYGPEYWVIVSTHDLLVNGSLGFLFALTFLFVFRYRLLLVCSLVAVITYQLFNMVNHALVFQNPVAVSFFLVPSLCLIVGYVLASQLLESRLA